MGQWQYRSTALHPLNMDYAELHFRLRTITDEVTKAPAEAVSDDQEQACGALQRDAQKVPSLLKIRTPAGMDIQAERSKWNE